MPVPKELYTPQTFFSLAGSATAVWLMTSVLGNLFPTVTPQVKRWFGFLLSTAFSLLGVSQAADHSLMNWVIAIVNGCFIYLTAVGTNEVLASRNRGARRRKAVRQTSAIPESNTTFFDAWWSDSGQ
jgi:hypothetical protein